MKTRIVCQECSAANQFVAVFFDETIRDDGVYLVHCPQGHQTTLMTQTLRHEMLFEIALNAIKDQYHREAISSFTGSMERFFEFAIRVLCRHRNVSAESLETCWNRAKKQSERQLGAYMFLYLAEFKKAPTLLPNSMIEKRNDVIHKGHLPNKGEALEFGNHVHTVIQDGIANLRSKCIGAVESVLCEQLTDRAKSIRETVGNAAPLSTQVSPTALNVIEDISSGYRPFSSILFGYGISAER
jgi:hypothetical protein